jgi:GTP cyclohydrolase IA
VTASASPDPEIARLRTRAQLARYARSADAVRDLLEALEVPRDEHTRETPQRVARAFAELLAGYAEDPADHLTRTFPGPDDAGLVAMRGLEFVSVCAHHLLPFTGTATIAYIPEAGAPIVGLSKLARLLSGYAARLQTQEHLGAEITAALTDRLKTKAAGCVITARHGCMAVRGVRQSDAEAVTSALAGGFLTDPAARAELMALHHAGSC